MKIQNKVFTIFQTVLGTIFTLPLLAPIFMILKLEFFAKPIYLLYSYSCHQLHWRSLHIGGYQAAWCMRDTFIWGGMFLSTFIVKRLNVRLTWKTLPLFIIPIALDGGIQTIGTMLGFAVCPHCQAETGYTSTNFTRATTGAWFGLGLGIFLSSVIADIDESLDIKQSLNKNFKYIFASFGFLMGIYLLLIQVWNFSSPDYKPVNALDLGVRIPAESDERWIRQLNGGCKPENEKNITSGDSFTDVIFLPQDCF